MLKIQPANPSVRFVSLDNTRALEYQHHCKKFVKIVLWVRIPVQMPLPLAQCVKKVKYKPTLVNQNVKIVAKASTTKTVKTLPQQMTIAVIAKRAQVVGWQQRELNNAVVCAQDHTPILNKANALMQVRVNQVNLKKIKQVRVQIVPADILPCLYRWVNQKHVLDVGWSWLFTLFILHEFSSDFIFIFFIY
jgi:hypothetical protein